MCGASLYHVLMRRNIIKKVLHVAKRVMYCASSVNAVAPHAYRCDSDQLRLHLSKALPVAPMPTALSLACQAPMPLRYHQYLHAKAVHSQSTVQQTGHFHGDKTLLVVVAL